MPNGLARHLGRLNSAMSSRDGSAYRSVMAVLAGAVVAYALMVPALLLGFSSRPGSGPPSDLYLALASGLATFFAAYVAAVLARRAPILHSASLLLLLVGADTLLEWTAGRAKWVHGDGVLLVVTVAAALGGGWARRIQASRRTMR
jgi:hypothetical protein